MDITLFVEHSCNLRCDYCYTGEKFRKTMDEDVLEASIELALSDAPRRVTLSFFGGEPLLRFPFLVRAVERYKARFSRELHPPQLSVVLNTNATLLSEAVIGWLVREQVGLNISLDGSEHVHDLHRVDATGRGSYRQVVRGISMARQSGLVFRLAAVIAPETAGRLGETAAELLRHSPKVATLIPNLEADWSEDALSAFRYGTRQAAMVWERAFRSGEQPILEPFLTKVLSHTMGGTARPGRCGVALREITVAPSGNLYTCAQQVEEDRDLSRCIGHVTSGVDMDKVRARRALVASVAEVCRECELRSRCSSDCGCKQLSAAGTLGQVDGLLCETEEAFVSAADAVAERLYSEKVPAFLELIYARRWTLRPGAELTQLRRAANDAQVAS